MEKNKNMYWSCIIGPAKAEQLPLAADTPMRTAVCSAFKDLIGFNDKLYSSGWGVTEERYYVGDVNTITITLDCNL